MKNRIILPALAFVLAIGAAFASAADVNQIGYVKITNPLQPCEQRSVPCSATGSITCLDGTQTVFNGSVMNSTSCGTALKRNP